LAALVLQTPGCAGGDEVLGALFGGVGVVAMAGLAAEEVARLAPCAQPATAMAAAAAIAAPMVRQRDSLLITCLLCDSALMVTVRQRGHGFRRCADAIVSSPAAVNPN
jgi:hypothetical protein